MHCKTWRELDSELISLLKATTIDCVYVRELLAKPKPAYQNKKSYTCTRMEGRKKIKKCYLPKMLNPDLYDHRCVHHILDLAYKSDVFLSWERFKPIQLRLWLPPASKVPLDTRFSSKEKSILKNSFYNLFRWFNIIRWSTWPTNCLTSWL